jgi:hypothetical protein
MLVMRWDVSTVSLAIESRKVDEGFIMRYSLAWFCALLPPVGIESCDALRLLTMRLPYLRWRWMMSKAHLLISASVSCNLPFCQSNELL